MRYGVSSRGMMDSCNNRHCRSSDVTVRLTHLVFAAWDRQGASKSMYSHASPGPKYDYTLRRWRFTHHPTLLHIPTPIVPLPFRRTIHITPVEPCHAYASHDDTSTCLLHQCHFLLGIHRTCVPQVESQRLSLHYNASTCLLHECHLISTVSTCLSPCCEHH
jgi:hypothetical protein